MEKRKTSFIKKVFSNIYVKNIGLMIAILVALLLITVLSLNLYTRHGSYVEVPNLTGLQEAEAEAVLDAAGLKYEIVDSLYDKKGVPGSIMDQIPSAKSKVKPGRLIFLTIKAKSQEMIVMPDVEDNSYRQSEALLNAIGFTDIKKETVESPFRDLVISAKYKGKVIRAGAKIPKGSPIVLLVGSGSGGDNEDAELVPEVDSAAVIDEEIQ